MTDIQTLGVWIRVKLYWFSMSMETFDLGWTFALVSLNAISININFTWVITINWHARSVHIFIEFSVPAIPRDILEPSLVIWSLWVGPWISGASTCPSLRWTNGIFGWVYLVWCISCCQALDLGLHRWALDLRYDLHGDLTLPDSCAWFAPTLVVTTSDRAPSWCHDVSHRFLWWGFHTFFESSHDHI